MKGILVGGPMHLQTFIYDGAEILDEVEVESKDNRTVYRYRMVGSNFELTETGAARVGLYHFVRKEALKKIRRWS